MFRQFHIQHVSLFNWKATSRANCCLSIPCHLQKSKYLGQWITSPLNYLNVQCGQHNHVCSTMEAGKEQQHMTYKCTGKWVMSVYNCLLTNKSCGRDIILLSEVTSLSHYIIDQSMIIICNTRKYLEVKPSTILGILHRLQWKLIIWYLTDRSQIM